MNRPYFKSNYSDLRQLYENSKKDRKVLQEILGELKHRRTPRAVALRKEIEESLKEMKGPHPKSVPSDGGASRGSPKKRSETAEKSRDVSQKTGDAGINVPSGDEPQVEPEPALSHDFHLVEPIGKAVGHPQKRIFPLKDDITLDLPLDAPINRRYAVALRLLISEMKKEGAGRRKISLENGEAVPIDGREKGYQFKYEDTVDLFEGASVTARIGSTESSGHVMAVMQGSLIISLEKDFGQSIRVCVLSVDNTAMLETLSRRLENVDEGQGVRFNHALAISALTNNSDKANQSLPAAAELLAGLNERQQAAINLALRNEISYIWGPPGTGKTRTLTALMRALFDSGKRILICSNTNQAVDQVLLKLCEAMGPSHPAVNDGKIIRIGRIAHERLEQDWSSYVTVSGVVDRKSIELRARLHELETQVAPLRETMGQIDRLLLLLDQIDATKEEERLLASRTVLAQEKVKKADQTARSLDDKAKALDDELARFTQAGVLRRVFMRSEDAILRDRQQTTQQKAQIQAQITSGRREYSEASEAQGGILNRIKELEQRIPPGMGSRKELDGKKAKLEDKLQPLLGEIAEINKKLADMELSVIQAARIIGATVTKTYLSPMQFVGFDAVLVDEASMVMLPAFYYAAGLAGERVVISGDFRQLQPIVQTKQRALAEIIGSDVFKAAGITQAVESGVAPPRLVMLDTQYRMQKPICDLISSMMYERRLKTQRDIAVSEGRPPAPFDQTLTVVDTSRIWPFVNRDAFGSKYNLMHALAIRNLCLHLHEQRYIRGTGDIGVATPYAAQAKLLRRILKGNNLEQKVAAGTIHRYQGDEKRLMILDLPDSLGESRVGTFLEADNPQDSGAPLINVGISRAQDHLVVFANLTYLQDKLPDRAVLRDILDAMQTRGQIVDVRDVLALRPVMNDLERLQKNFQLELDAEKAGLFRHKDFEAVCMADLESAKQSVAIFSGFVTPQRVAAYGDLFRRKLSEGVTIRCVTRPPNANGSVPKDQGKEALDVLEGLGCIVDTRWSIHEKVVIIDERIVWFGSLNMLSHTVRTDEMMMRLDNAAVALQVAIFMALERTSSAETGEGLSVKNENPRCPKCRSRTCYRKGRYGPYWSCEACNWTASIDKPLITTQGPSEGGSQARESTKKAPLCPKCGVQMVIRNGPHGSFYGCSRYPDCRLTASLKSKSKKRSQQ